MLYLTCNFLFDIFLRFIYTDTCKSHALQHLTVWIRQQCVSVFSQCRMFRVFTVFLVTNDAAINAQPCLFTSPWRPAPARVSRQSQQTLMHPLSSNRTHLLPRLQSTLLPPRPPCSYWTHPSALVKDVDRNLLRIPRGLCLSDVVLALPPPHPAPPRLEHGCEGRK